MTDLARHFSEAARREGDRIALITPHERVSFAEIDRRAAAFAATGAARGICKGDRVLVVMPVGIDLYVALAACWRLGAVAVFPEPAMGLKGLRHAVAVTRPAFVFASGIYRLVRFLPALWRCPRLAPHAADRGAVDPVALTPDDCALISFTSGSTGAPKAIPRSHGFLMAQHAAVRSLLASDRPETDLVAFPVFALVNLADGRCSALPDWRISRPETVTQKQLSAWITRSGATRAVAARPVRDAGRGGDSRCASQPVHRWRTGQAAACARTARKKGGAEGRLGLRLYRGRADCRSRLGRGDAAGPCRDGRRRWPACRPARAGNGDPHRRR
ncbi:MAG: AMP-binding protein [Rhodobacter sp.]|nr:AMP-binding protein [Rhodobacter sp.]